MRRIWGAVLLIGCSTPASESLPAGPPRSPRPCKDADLVAAMLGKTASAATQHQHDVLADFASSEHLTLDNTQLPVFVPERSDGQDGWDAPPTVPHDALPANDVTMHAVDQAARAHPRDDDFVLDLGGPGSWRTLVVDAHYFDHRGCNDAPSAEYHVAHRADGTPVVVRERIVEGETSQVEECGTCTVGCGFPGVELPWIAFALPFASGTAVPILDVEADLDELHVSCERERLAQ